MDGSGKWESEVTAELDHISGDVGPEIDEAPAIGNPEDIRPSFKWMEALNSEGLFHKIRLFRPYASERVLTRSGMK